MTEETQYKKDIELTKEFIGTSPWKTNPGRYPNWCIYLGKLCRLHKTKRLNLVVDKSITTPCYQKIMRVVYLQKFSLISLLHEFAHHIGKNEQQCKKYSEHIFLTANPKAKNYLVRDERGYLIKKQEAGGAKK